MAKNTFVAGVTFKSNELQHSRHHSLTMALL